MLVDPAVRPATKKVTNTWCMKDISGYKSIPAEPQTTPDMTAPKRNNFLQNEVVTGSIVIERNRRKQKNRNIATITTDTAHSIIA